MSRRLPYLTVMGVGLCLACPGCDKEKFKAGLAKLKLTKDEKPAPEEAKVPPEVAGTVAEFAGLVGGGSMLVDGHGLVVGLGKNGSAEVPPALRKYLVQYMLQQKVGSPMAGGGGVTPSQIIADRDTAVVRLFGAIPPGAPVGWTFDVRATALSGTSTRSLDGGVLFPAELTLARGEGTPPTSGARAWAGAEGSTFINPFLDPNKPSDSAQFREGRLIGGGIVKESRPMSLVLRQADYARASLIQRRINERFGQPVKVANAKSASVVELKIPRAYRQDYSRFLLLLMHLPLQAGPGRSEARAREIAREMLQPGANHDGLALVWEAMGSQVIPVCRTLYAHANLPAAFHAARTGLRLEDKLAGDVMMRMAETSGSPFQVASIEEMGRAAWMVRSIPVLRRLVDADNELVRIAAYDALVKLGDTSLITRLDIDGEFALYMVTSRRSYVIYATQSLQKRIVLFGRDMAVSRRLFFNMPNDLVTITNRIVDVDEEGDYVDLAKYKARGDQPPQTTKAERMMVFRSIARTGSISAPFFIDRSVRSLVATLGRRAQRGADGKIRGLELNYGQIVSVLYRMCEVDKDIPAKFVLQPAPATRRIYRDATSLGRPDMPGE